MRGIANNKDPLSLRTPQFQTRQDIEGPTDQGLHVRFLAQHLHQVKGFRGTKLHGICDDYLSFSLIAIRLHESFSWLVGH